MEKRKALLTIALAAVMLVGGCGKAAESTQAAGTKNAEGRYDPVVTINIAKQLDEMRAVTGTERISIKTHGGSGGGKAGH